MKKPVLAGFHKGDPFGVIEQDEQQLDFIQRFFLRF